MAERRYLLLGSGEFEPWSIEVERRALGGRKGPVVVLATASSAEGDATFDRWASMGLAHYEDASIPAIALPLKTRDDAGRKDLVERLDDAAMVYFSGGDPKHLASVMSGTPFWTRLVQRLDDGLVYAGCSAGAMIASSSGEGARHKVGIGWLTGEDLIPNTMFGVHWDKVSRIPGARGFFSSRVPDGLWFLGIDERTAILGDGISWTVHGLGTVTVAGGSRRWIARPGDTIETG